VYGSPDGPYFMLPGLGPTVLIDRGGDFVVILSMTISGQRRSLGGSFRHCAS